MPRTPKLRKCLPPLLLVALLAAGCSGGGKAGGSAAEHARVLTLANPNGELPAQLARFAREVEHRSHGRLRLKVESRWRLGQIKFEPLTIRDVRAGRADLAWVGARAWDSVGVRSFDPLIAPFLIDNYELERRVFERGIPQAMVRGVEGAGVTGVGVLPGPLRTLLGVRHPLVRLRDFGGAVIGVNGELAAKTFRAFGARPRQIPAGSKLGGLDGIEQQLSSIAGNNYVPEGARYVSAGLHLWPRPLVVFARNEVWASLTPNERDVLRESAAAVIDAAVSASRQEDREGIALLCRQHATFVSEPATASAELERGVNPVYGALTREPRLRRDLRAIRALKDQTHGDQPPVCGGSIASSARAPTSVDGVYEMETGVDAAAPDYMAENYGRWIFVLDGGRFADTQENKDACTWGYGTFRLDAGTMSWTFIAGGGLAPNRAYNKPGEFFRFRLSRYRDALSLARVAGAVSPLNFRARPWHLVSDTPTRRYFSKRCPPPRKALP
jgi:TRAP-type C4-dicarboxylate transport system substrate-binding protein